MTKWFVRYEVVSGRVRESAKYSEASAAANAAELDASQAAIISDLPPSVPNYDEIWVVDGAVVNIDQADQAVVEATLTPERITAAVDRINREAADILGAVASPLAPQVAVYTAKEAEATAWTAVVDGGGTPSGANYPLLDAGKSVEGRTLAEEAAAVLAEAAQWKQAGAAVDAVRRAANKAVGQATSRAEVQAVLDNLTWPDLGL